ncbi:probable cytosolic oligopeptidase A [Limulus polyphemus]|uniref:oligopeptidase A n=1 Tax=Limulus polyphemus TaxID=6850 RepID=A0ABM1C5A7_LIMPO|nr:probable cytosolic oligopeptidase A [Limulus polyphemus]
MAALSVVSARNGYRIFGSSVYSSLQRNIRRSKYIVLVPEIPDETPETNPLLRQSALPKYSQLTPEKCVNAIGKLVIEYESGICRLEEQLKDGGQQKNFTTVIEPLEKLTNPLDYAWSTMKNLCIVTQNEQITRAYKKLHPRVQKAKTQRFHSQPIFHAMKEINADRDKLSEVQQRVIDKCLLESRLDGIELWGYEQKHFNNTLVNLAKYKNQYREKLTKARSAFSHTITDIGIVADFPDELIKEMAVDRTNPSRGPWIVTLDPHIYNPFMKFCSDRLLRWNIWNANVTLASATSQDVNNSIEIEEIRSVRKEQAKLLGYNNFAQMSMETKMAGNVENALSMITTLRLKSKAATEKELSELQEFAAECGFEAKLELWDVPFWRQKQKESLFRIDYSDIQQYFPYPVVLQGLFNFCKEIFGITFKEATSEVDVWHPDVQFFKIYDENDSYLASFYIDPYIRQGQKLPGAWMEAACNRSKAVGTSPLSYMIFSFPKPSYQKPSLLSFHDVVALFKKFGHLLQNSLTTVPYSDVSGLTNLEWDVVDVCPHFMTCWLKDYNTIASCSSHVENGNAISEDLHNQLLKAECHMAGYDLTKELYLSALDLELYSSKEFWLDITKRVWPEYMNFPLEKQDAHPCSFSEIFCDEYPAAYFSFKWAEMIAADAFSAFLEAGLDNKISQRFRDTFLSLGGGCHPSEVFRRFRGRDPSPDALLAACGLMKPAIEKEKATRH